MHFDHVHMVEIVHLQSGWVESLFVEQIRSRAQMSPYPRLLP